MSCPWLRFVGVKFVMGLGSVGSIAERGTFFFVKEAPTAMEGFETASFVPETLAAALTGPS